MQREVKSPVEGSWEMVSATAISGDTVTNYKVPETGSQIKMWTSKHFAFTGILLTDTSKLDVYGNGTYTLNGDKYEESITYHNDKSFVNTKAKFLLEIRNDTLYQKGVTDENWNLPGAYAIEKYVRVD